MKRVNNDLAGRAQDSGFLSKRLDINSKYSKEDFSAWLCGHLSGIKFNTVLDVACGTGSQTIWFAKRLNGKGKVCAFDISKKSVDKVRSISKDLGNVEACVGDMDELEKCVNDNFSIKEFDLIHSSYALYYSKKPESVFSQMLKFLSKDGAIAVCGPHSLNTLLDFLAKYQNIPQQSRDCLKFIDDVAANFLQKHFKDISSHIFVNNLYVTDIRDLAEYYGSSTFYNKNAEDAVLKAAQKIIVDSGSFHIQKNAKLLIARDLA